jgi:hypothetical protein
VFAAFYFGEKALSNARITIGIVLARFLFKYQQVEKPE